MTTLQALLLGVIEGLTEFLPISSTGHLILVEAALGIESSAALSSFNIAIQLGAIAAVLMLYGRQFLVDRAVFLRVAVAFLPTMVWGLALYPVVKEYLLKSPEVVCWSLSIGGVVLILFEWMHGEKLHAKDGIASLSWRDVFLIGNFQALAMLPGVSRSAATVVGALLLGVRRRTGVEFSFLLAVPTMAAATTLDLYKTRNELSSEFALLMLVGFLAAFVTALVAIRLLLHFVKRYSFAGFGAYRIGAAAFFAWLLFFR